MSTTNRFVTMYDDLVDYEEHVLGPIFSTNVDIQAGKHDVSLGTQKMSDSQPQGMSSCSHIGHNSGSSNDGTFAAEEQSPLRSKKLRGTKPKKGYPEHGVFTC